MLRPKFISKLLVYDKVLPVPTHCVPTCGLLATKMKLFVSYTKYFFIIIVYFYLLSYTRTLGIKQMFMYILVKRMVLEL